MKLEKGNIMRHKWTKEDDILAFYLYRYGEYNLISLKSVAQHIGFTNTDSLEIRIQNFRAVDKRGGLKNYAKLTKQVYDEYKNLDQETHKKKCLEIMRIT